MSTEWNAGYRAGMRDVRLGGQEAEARRLLTRALPLLVQLGDYIGNGPVNGDRLDSLGERCDLIGDIKDLLEGNQS